MALAPAYQWVLFHTKAKRPMPSRLKLRKLNSRVFLFSLALHICHRLVVGQSHGKGGIEEKVLGEDPVVCIATTARYVGILHRTKTQFVVDVATELFTHLVDYHIFQFLPVHLQRMAGVTYACQPTTGASSLNSTLRISCWIRENFLWLNM